MSTSTHATPPASLLIVEDCSITLKCYSSILTMLCPDITVYTAGNGTAGMELFTAHRPDIVVTDLNMPEMDGRQLIAKIRGIKPDAKLIVLTGDKESLERHDTTTAYDYLIGKPVDFQELFAAIRQCIADISCQDS